MFTFRTTTFLFFFFMLLLNILGLSGFSIHFLYYVALLFVYLGVSVGASFFIGSGFHLKAICRRETKHKVIAITFDDGPHTINTPVILDILKGRAKATFFCIGNKISGNEPLLKRMNEEGHIIGMHSFSHSNWFDLYSSSRMKKEMIQTEELISGIIGKRPLLFRPPYGVINPMVKKALSYFPYHVIGFSARSWDTVTKEKGKIVQRTLKKLQSGDIVLFHDTVAFAPGLIGKFLDAVSDKGYIILGLDELCNIQAYEE